MVGQSKIKIKENDENGVAAPKRRSTAEVEHWAFLEEVEAPMWADLTLEPQLISEDNDDSWFHTSHLFHHHSARHLRSVFAHPDVGNDLFNLCSPKFLSSVSKSRGKDYRSRDWNSNCRQISLDKDHPVNGLGSMISVTNAVSSEECISRVSHEHQSEAFSSITSLVDDSVRRVAVNSQSGSTSGVSTSTMTTVSMQRDLLVLEVSNEGFGQTGGLLNALRTNLRKSRATRPASRVAKCEDRESNGRKCDDRKSNGCKSSAGKSSVGSSSTGYDTKYKIVVPKIDRCKQVRVQIDVNKGSKGHTTPFGRPNQGSTIPKFEVKKVAAGFKLKKDRNPNVRDLKELAKPFIERVKAKNLSETSVFTRNTYSSKIEGKDAAAVSSKQAASKSKVLHQLTPKNSLNQLRTGTLNVKSKVKSSQLNKVANSGKENMRERSVLSHRSGGKDNEPVVRVSDHKVPKSKSKTQIGVTSIASKVRINRKNDGIMSLDTQVHRR